MEYSAPLLVCGVIYLADTTGAVYIEHCDTSLDIRESAENITCREFGADDTINWYIKTPDALAYVAIATCTPVNCTLYEHDQFTAQRSPQISQPVFRQQNRTEDVRAKIMCESLNQTGGLNQRTACSLNVISPTVLSGCVVEEDRDKGAVNGSCHFEHAFSSLNPLFCSWGIRMLGQISVVASGHLNKEVYTSDGQVYYRGQCTMSLALSGQQWNAGDYSYTIFFYPGSGPQSVPVGSLNPPLTTTPTPGPPSTATSTGAPPPPATRDDEKGENCVGVAFAAVGVTLAVVIVVVVVVVVWLRRRRWILPCADKKAGAELERRSFRQPAQANGERRERLSEIYEIPDTPHGQQGNGRRTHLRDNSPTTVTSTGDKSRTTVSSLSPAADNSPTTESSHSPTWSTTVNNPLQTGDNSPANNYESLRTSDMGLRSVYSALTGPDYYNTGFVAGGAGDSTGVSAGETTGPGGETSPIYQN